MNFERAQFRSLTGVNDDSNVLGLTTWKDGESSGSPLKNGQASDTLEVEILIIKRLTNLY